MFGFGKKKKEKEARLLELQNILLADKYDKLITTEKNLMQFANDKIEQNNRISAESSKLLQTTTKPDVFFGRIKLLEEKTNELVMLEKYITFSEPKPSQVFEVFTKEKSMVTDLFLTRYFNSVLDKVETLKTDSAKNKNIQKCYDTLKPYFDRMSENNVLYVEKFYNQHYKKD